MVSNPVSDVVKFGGTSVWKGSGGTQPKFTNFQSSQKRGSTFELQFETDPEPSFWSAPFD